MRLRSLFGLGSLAFGATSLALAFARITLPLPSVVIEMPKEAPREIAVVPQRPEIVDADEPTTLPAQREALYAILRDQLDVSVARVETVRAIFEKSPVLGQGNPEVSRHPMARAECRAIREAEDARDDEGATCGSRFMVPLYHASAGEHAEGAKVCIDQFEFPGAPCEYPVVNVRANEAAELCAAVGKRICDAHEWEGACAGDLRSPDEEYVWGKPRLQASWDHNQAREKVWSYGQERDLALCATGSQITPGCPGGGWRECGSNTYPAGAFPSCASPFGVYDLHGNAAEHMNMPNAPDELASRGGIGSTEMKGSWFVFASIDAHQDDCHWRAPDWHASKIDNTNSHRNYHLGFRCCLDRTPGEATRLARRAPWRAFVIS